MVLLTAVESALSLLSDGATAFRTLTALRRDQSGLKKEMI
jgi:hypothetical protein